MKPYLLLFAVCTFFLSSLSAQINKGFEALRAGDMESAEQYFKKKVKSKGSGAMANYGLAQIKLKETKSVDRMLEAYTHASDIGRFKKPKSYKKKRKLREKGWLPKSPAGFKSMAQDSLILTLKEVDELLEFDKAFLFFEANRTYRLRGKAKKEFQRIRRRVVGEALKSSNDYPTLKSLYTTHRKFIDRSSYLFPENLQWRLMWAFIAENGLEEIGRFVEEFPDHDVGADCWFDEFEVAVQDSSFVRLLDFLNDHPLTVLDVLVFHQYRNYDYEELMKQGLTKDQARLLESIQLGKELEYKLSRRQKLSDEEFGQLAFYLESNAPSPRAYLMMKDAMQSFLQKKQWEFADSLVVFAQPLFPDEQPADCRSYYDYYQFKEAWFEVATPIILRPEEGIEVNSLKGVNTGGDEFSPVISADAKTLYFAGSGRRDNVSGEDVFVTHLRASGWSKPQAVEHLSGEANFVPLSLTSDGNQMLVFVDGELHMTYRTLKGWKEPEKMPEKLNRFTWIGRAVLSPNGRVLIMAASEKVVEIDEAANTDIFISIKNNKNQWGDPFPIGDQINTKGQERSPFLHTDGKSLYFSSNQQKGLGGMDIYKVKRLDDTWKNWSKPENMGKEINTLEDDWGFNYTLTTTGKSAYLSGRNRYGRNMDLYYSGLPSFVQPERLAVIKGHVKIDKPYPIVLIAKDAETGEVLDRTKVTPDGDYSIVVPTGRTVVYHINNLEYFPFSHSVDLTEETDVVEVKDSLLAISYYEMKQGKVAPLQTLFFETNKYELNPGSFIELESFYNTIKGQQVKVEIGGYADPKGSEVYNLELSQKRAEAVRDHLIGLGLEPERITAKGYGESLAESEELSANDMAQIRKVEIRISADN
jgi:outer membrane protein OmpA-like peptidoglycan-associated protein